MRQARGRPRLRLIPAGLKSTCDLRWRFPYSCHSTKAFFFFFFFSSFSPLLRHSEEKAKLLRDVMAKIEAKNEVLEYV